MRVTVPSVAESGTDVLRELAIVLYQREKLTLGRAARLAGMDRWAFNDLLADRDVPMHYDVADLEHDLATLRRLADR
jgi:predicted HTH domain antitoxin